MLNFKRRADCLEERNLMSRNTLNLDAKPGQQILNIVEGSGNTEVHFLWQLATSALATRAVGADHRVAPSLLPLKAPLAKRGRVIFKVPSTRLPLLFFFDLFTSSR